MVSLSACSARSPKVHNAPLNPSGGLLYAVGVRGVDPGGGVGGTTAVALVSGVGGVPGAPVPFLLYSAAFLARKLPQLLIVAFAAAPAVAAVSVATEVAEAAVAAVLAEGAKERGLMPRLGVEADGVEVAGASDGVTG